MTGASRPTVTVGPNLDAYGGRARACAIADYLEVAALSGMRITRDDLEDLATELGWSRKRRRQVLVEGDDPEDDPEGWAEQAFAMTDERADILEPLYPFVEQRGALHYAGCTPLDDPYVALLAISVVHGWSLPCTAKPSDVLEGVVARVLEARYFRVAPMGTAERNGAGFSANLLASGTSLGLKPTATPRPIASSAKDAGVDTLAALTWEVGRRGQWVMIGQVTCGSSLTWGAKLDEPKPSVWRAYLQEALDPQAFLAVPHHIERRHLAELLATQRGLVLDRLRMAQVKPANVSDERIVIQAMLGASVE